MGISIPGFPGYSFGSNGQRPMPPPPIFGVLERDGTPGGATTAAAPAGGAKSPATAAATKAAPFGSAAGANPLGTPSQTLGG